MHTHFKCLNYCIELNAYLGLYFTQAQALHMQLKYFGLFLCLLMSDLQLYSPHII